MCGIAGFLTVAPGRDDRELLARMTGALAHRGPDDHGLFVDPAAGVALGHRRLAIVDLSPRGHQPMASASGSRVVVYNGEIYNFRALRGELAAAGARFVGDSDTEVLLAAVERWGLEAAVRRLVGIFAFALWDAPTRTLHLVRDHLGVKPLHYARVPGGVAFGSELRALRRHPGFDDAVDRDALALLLRHNCVPAPHTIHRGARKLPPGSIVSIPADAADGPLPAPRAYWSARDVAEVGAASRRRWAREEAADALDALLRDAVGLQMLADVPLGAFLSGGIDSSTVVALMQAQTGRAVRTFSIGVADPQLDESGDARRIARHLGTDHTELQVTEADAREVVPLLPRIFDEPFADSSQIPTFLVSRLARASVTVALSGDGGDELFAGYNRHVWAERLWRRLRVVPRAARRAARQAILAVAPETWDRGARAAAVLRRGARGPRRFGANLHKLAGVMDARGAADLYLGLASHWRAPDRVVRGAREPLTLVTDGAAWPALGTLTEQMMYLDLVTYLPDDILVKVDRASMAVGLEARVPLLDHRVVEFAWSLPLDAKLRDGVGKRVLRDVLHRYVPRELVDRPKSGFGVPVGAWLRGPLRDWVDTLLEPGLLRRDGFLDPRAVDALWQAHRAGRADHQFELWDVLAFQSWYHEGGRNA